MVFFLCLFRKLKVQQVFSCITILLTHCFKGQGEIWNLQQDEAQLLNLAMFLFALKNFKLSPRKCGVNHKAPSKTRAVCVFQAVHKLNSLLGRLRTCSGLFLFTCQSTVTHTSFGCPSKTLFSVVEDWPESQYCYFWAIFNVDIQRDF